MKMIQGYGSISDYGQYISNCTLKQMNYKVPVNSLSDVQLYINIGEAKPATVQYELIHTCGGGTVGSTIPTDYIIGQEKNNNWYGVFKNFTGTTPTCFVIAITFTFAGQSGEVIYFSEEYCVESDCSPLVLIKGCYGNLDNKISTDCEGVYFGTHAGAGIPLGDTSIVYKHQILLRGVEVTLSANKNIFKQGRSRTFRTEKEKIFQFWSELVPEWYLPEIDAVFFRGEVYVGETKYLLNETQFEKVEDCFKQWKPIATFKESCLQSFSCEADPCIEPDGVCCDPIIISVGVTEITNTAMNTIVVECVVDQPPVVTGTASVVTGITDGSTVVTCAAFAGVRVVVERGHIQIGSINPLDGSAYYTKNLADDFITFSSGLVNGEFIYIETIPN